MSVASLVHIVRFGRGHVVADVLRALFPLGTTTSRIFSLLAHGCKTIQKIWVAHCSRLPASQSRLKLTAVPSYALATPVLSFPSNVGTLATSIPDDLLMAVSGKKRALSADTKGSGQVRTRMFLFEVASSRSRGIGFISPVSGSNALLGDTAFFLPLTERGNYLRYSG